MIYNKTADATNIKKVKVAKNGKYFVFSSSVSPSFDFCFLRIASKLITENAKTAHATDNPIAPKIYSKTKLLFSPNTIAILIKLIIQPTSNTNKVPQE